MSALFASLRPRTPTRLVWGALWVLACQPAQPRPEPDSRTREASEGGEAGQPDEARARQRELELSKAARRSPIKSDEVVQLFPGYAYRVPGSADTWAVPVRGWIYEPEERDRLRNAMLEELREVLGELPEGPVLEARLRTFMVDSESGKRLPIEAAGVVAVSSSSGLRGHFDVELRVPEQAAASFARTRAQRRVLELQAVSRASDARRFTGEALLVEPQGLTIVSDIDDTVKITEVRDKRALLERTFLRPFEVVPGMAELYTRWMAQAQAPHLHFVSASPWQLQRELGEMLAGAGFGPASFDLELYGPEDISTSRFGLRENKGKKIRELMARYPQRQFVLVGDSGERDPEIYGELARAFPKAVVFIAIRKVSPETQQDPRYLRAFAGVESRWELFEDPAALAGLL